MHKFYPIVTLCILMYLSASASTDKYIYAAIDNFQEKSDCHPFKVAHLYPIDINKDVIAVVFYTDDWLGTYGIKDTTSESFPNAYREYGNRLYIWKSDTLQHISDDVVSKLKEYGVVDDSRAPVIVTGWDYRPIFLMHKEDTSIFALGISTIYQMKKKYLMRLQREFRRKERLRKKQGHSK